MGCFREIFCTFFARWVPFFNKISVLLPWDGNFFSRNFLHFLCKVGRVNHTVFDTLRPFWLLHFTWTGETYHTWLWVGPPGKLHHTTKERRTPLSVSWSAAVMDRVHENTSVIDTLWQLSTPFNISLLRKWFVAFDLVQLILNEWWNKICFKLKDVIPFSLVYILRNTFVLKFFHMYSDIYILWPMICALYHYM